MQMSFMKTKNKNKKRRNECLYKTRLTISKRNVFKKNIPCSVFTAMKIFLCKCGIMIKLKIKIKLK